MARSAHKAPRCNIAAHWLGRLVIAASGWRIEGGVPDVSKFIMIGAPHTSNWDLILLLAAAYSFRLSVNWLGKDTLFRTVLGPILRFVGGIPVDRSKHNDMVASLVADIGRRDSCAIVIPPEGTRSRTEYWKSGFYWIAKGAGIPIVFGYLDYKRKVAGLGPSFMLTGDVAADMDRIRAFYQDIPARYPEKKAPIRLRDETGTRG